MPRVVTLAAVGASLAALASQTPSRNFLLKWSGITAPGGVWRIIAIIFALANLKSLPFAWHLRIFRAFAYQLYLQPTPIPPHALFQPIVTSTRTSIFETDYNLHKSNSTYFSDMDISRAHLFSAIIRNSMRNNARKHGGDRGAEAIQMDGGSGDAAKGKHIVALGGISCLFKREILPYQKFEMWTRLLTWDRKWFYLVTHLVRPGVGRPKSYTLQPWKKGKADKALVNGEEKEHQERMREKLKGAVYATSLSKYVIKHGRITVSPEKALRDGDMVPPKPDGWIYKGEVSANGNGSIDESALPMASGEQWDWDIIEAERQRGLRFAEHFAALDGLHEAFDGGENGVLGEYADFLFA
ncbi:hypothetical protein EJ04DRAFT_504474 [Polyplosphaeria fusca]|uniref:Uncharacterized protein n=1 Tax=Polyplosphaeria fusca TaxID=682080 RepID=A0A9P4QJ05_9PLEO|nr:hypothetical protein EJ04DRAFT_504474 [Polyplosphaeria fusca]